MNRSLFLISKYVLSYGNLFYQIKVYLILQLPRRKSLEKYVLFSLWNRTGNLGSFCFGCRAKKKKITLIGDNSLAEREVIGYFFYCGYDYKPIVHLLKTHCDISLSERTLKRRL